MKNLLIINLRRIGDIYSTGHLINSIKQNYPDTTVSMLIYREFEATTRNLAGVDQFYFIDRKKITSLRKNPIFSPSLAIEKLYNELNEIKNIQWDQIVNYSNDLVGSYFTSYLSFNQQNCQCLGIKHISSQTMTRSSDWAIMLNDVLPCYKHTPVHFTDCYHQMMQIPWRSLSGETIKTHSKHDKSVNGLICKIKDEHNGKDEFLQIVGIQLKTSDLSKDIPAETIIELLNTLLDNPKIYPILLIAPTKAEQDLATDINSYFDNTLTVLESDLYALGSIIKQLDCLITPDTFIKHMCDLCGTPVVEVSKGKSPFLKQGTYNLDSYILTPSLTTRNFDSSDTTQEGRINASDIIQCLYLSLKHISLNDIKLSPDAAIYAPIRDELGISYVAVAGSYDLESELSRYLSRYYIKKMFGFNSTLDLSYFQDARSSRLISWIDTEKNAVTELTRDLLATLKHLLLSQKNQTKSRDFVFSLEKLLSHSDKHHIVSLPLHFFKARVDSLPGDSFSQNIQYVEELLYKFKTDVQLVLTCFKEFEITIQEGQALYKTNYHGIGVANQ